MNGNQIQAKVYAGYAKAASVIGVSYNLFRPISPVAPFGNQVSTLLAALDSTSSYKFKEPNSYGDPTRKRHLFHCRETVSIARDSGGLQPACQGDP